MDFRALWNIIRMMKKSKKKVFLLINVAEKAILLEREDNTNRFRTVYYISVKISITTQYSFTKIW